VTCRCGRLLEDGFCTECGFVPVDCRCATTNVVSLERFLEQEVRPRAKTPKDEERLVKRIAVALRPSAADIAIELAQERFTFGTSTEGMPFAVMKNGPNLVLRFKGGRQSVRSALAHAFWTVYGKAIPTSALASALVTLEGIASREAERDVHVRVGREDVDTIWLDLGEPAGKAIRLTPGQWDVCERSPVLFRRTELTRAYPMPEPGGGHLDDLLGLCHLEPDDLWLMLGWQIASVIPDVAHPVLVFFGEQGAGKTTAMRIATQTVDPSGAATRSVPMSPRDWITTAAGSWVIPLDNLSTLPSWLSDAMCRASTGDAYAARALYTDDGLIVRSFRRAVAFTAIGLNVIRGDLADRMVAVQVPRFGTTGRVTDAVLDAELRTVLPGAFGELLDLAVATLQRMTSMSRPDRSPRMADFHQLLLAMDAETGSASAEYFVDKASRTQREVLESSPLGGEVVHLIENEIEWEGDAKGLLRRLTPLSPPRGWPTSPKALRNRLRELAPALRSSGYGIEMADELARHDQGGRSIHLWILDVSVPADSSGRASSADETDRADETRSHEQDLDADERAARALVNEAIDEAGVRP
jgi:hypothetical protein